MSGAASQWAAELAAWEIPAPILEAAPRDPYVFPRAVIAKPSADPLTTPTGRAVLAALEVGESLIDVGCGAGRNSGAFVADHTVIGVEPRQNLAALARERGIAVHLGRWPESAAAVGPAPVVLSHHVMYDVQDPVPFLAAMHDRATRRVVIEITDHHPWVSVGPLYALVHGIQRPTGPSAQLLASVITDVIGRGPEQASWRRPGAIYADLDSFVDQQYRMLCIDGDHPRAGELVDVVAKHVTIDADGAVRLPETAQTTLWWDVSAA